MEVGGGGGGGKMGEVRGKLAVGGWREREAGRHRDRFISRHTRTEMNRRQSPHSDDYGGDSRNSSTSGSQPNFFNDRLSLLSVAALLVCV